jgi:hypothetical protein
MNTRRLILPTLLVMAPSACSNAATGWTGALSDSAGVTIVSNPEIGLWAPGQEWTLAEEIRIGALDEPSEYVFGSIGGIAVDSRGRIFVLDDHAQHIRVYSSDGVFLHTVGSRGEGPGELQTAWPPLVGPGDTLFVPDGNLLRINLYAPDGSSVGSFRWDLEGGRTMAFKSSASGVIAEQIRPMWNPLDAPTEAEGLTDLIVLRALDGTLSDTLMVLPSGEMMGPGGVQVFASEPVWDLADGLQVAVGFNDDYRISVYRDHRLERIILKPIDRNPVDDLEREAIMGEMERRWAEASISEEMVVRLRSRWSFADFYPAYQDLAFGPMGTIWVQRVKWASELSGDELRDWQNARSPEWEVLDSEGRFLGVVRMPPRFTPMLFRGEKVFGVVRDSLDVQHVARLGVQSPLED